MANISARLLPLGISLLILSGCSNSQSKEDAASTQQSGAPTQQSGAPTQRFGVPQQQVDTSVAPAPQMQPLQPGQPPQKPLRSISTSPAVVGGQPGTNTIAFNQPFRLANEEYQFIAAKGKNYVGLDSNPAMKPRDGHGYFLVRYQVINHGSGNVVVPNAAAVHLFNLVDRQISDIDQAATNANVQSGAATGLPNQLVLEPEQPQIQTLVFELPSTTNIADLSVLVTEPTDPKNIFQIVRLAN